MIRSTQFIDATGAHAGALLGDVRHDPFQSGGLETLHMTGRSRDITKPTKVLTDEINTSGLSHSSPPDRASGKGIPDYRAVRKKLRSSC